jgi:hypothetical protein
VLETTNEGTFLRGLAEGKPHVSGQDGLLSYADVTQYAANQWLFDTPRTDLEALTADNGQPAHRCRGGTCAGWCLP